MNAFFKDSANFVTIVTAFFRTGFFLFVTVATCAFFDSMWVRSFEWVKHSEAFCFRVPLMISAEFSPGQALGGIREEAQTTVTELGTLVFFSCESRPSVELALITNWYHTVGSNTYWVQMVPTNLPYWYGFSEGLRSDTLTPTRRYPQAKPGQVSKPMPFTRHWQIKTPLA